MTKKKLLISVHANTRKNTINDSLLSFDRGADGIFLVNHRISFRLLSKLYGEIRTLLPTEWIGINFLDLNPIEAIDHASVLRPSGLWLDSIGYQESDWNPTAEVKEIYAHKQSMIPECLLFGSVAFKYQRSVKDPTKAAKLCSEFVDVVTTSGSKTGEEAPLDKISKMKRAIGEKPLALASGITPENYHKFLDADYFIVNTGLCDKNGLNGDRISLLKQRLLSV